MKQVNKQKKQKGDKMKFERKWYVGNRELIFKNEELGIEVFKKVEAGSIFGMFFQGKRQKPDWNYRFKSEERFNLLVEKSIKAVEEKAANKKRARLEKKNFVHSVKVGDIFHYSWGYDQTQCEFFQVVELIGKSSVKIKEISARTVKNSENYDSDRRTPVKDSFFNNEEMVKRINNWNGIRMSCGHASLVEEQELERGFYCSWGR